MFDRFVRSGLAIFIMINLVFLTPAFASEQILYNAARQGDTVSDIGCVLRKTGDGKTLLEVSILTKGQGANFRRWTPDRPYLLAGAERITPVKSDKFYASKESFARPIGVIVFAAIGTQYVGHSHVAVASPGAPHDVTITEVEHTGAAEAIDRVGMAAGLGFLASQASGQITGLKMMYDLTGRENELANLRLKFQAMNNGQRRQPLDVTVPLRFSTERGEGDR
ncbi:MAG: hypothetical protein ACREH5_07410 [Candidatus Omnitrophota bacterium]